MHPATIDPNLDTSPTTYLSHRHTTYAPQTPRPSSAPSPKHIQAPPPRRPPPRLGTSNNRRPSIERSRGNSFAYRSCSVAGLEAGEEVWHLLQAPKSHTADRTVVVITGAHTGVGYETVKALVQSNRTYHIFLGGRDSTKAAAACQKLKFSISHTSSPASVIEPLQIDVDSDASILTASRLVSSKFDRIDVLLNNADTSLDAQITQGQLTAREAWLQSYNTNVVGANIVTETFLPSLLKSNHPRLLFITSGASSLTDAADPHHRLHKVPPEGWPKPVGSTGTMAYRSSKTALNMLMCEWHRLLKNDGVKVWAVAPALPATGFGADAERLQPAGAEHLKLGAQAIVAVVEGQRDAHVGRVVREYGERNIQAW